MHHATKYNDSHWTSIVADFQGKKICYIEPKVVKRMHHREKQFQSYINQRNEFTDDRFCMNDGWKIHCPSHQTQRDEHTCGVYVIYFMYQVIRNEALNRKFDPAKYLVELIRKIWHFAPSGSKTKLTLALTSGDEYPHPLVMENGLFNNVDYICVEYFNDVVSVFQDICSRIVRVQVDNVLHEQVAYIQIFEANVGLQKPEA
ncbi:hypothetical protein PR048_013419 [Dryococelus australis]|uniref:Ubiquitin-like protease family profile domain-containing protein n=1 Tax=Dryococelus australis TaxID=614101 RepID=A0ABQ9HS43_9NEOP|nr:hypothetical protein PR048_013419 [Dryococelus australis]